MKKIKIILMGTSTFALPSFEKIINDDNFEVVAVFTQADKKVGRKQVITSTPVKKYIQAKYQELPIFTPERLRDVVIEKQIRDLAPDLIYIVSYGQILPEAILNLPKLGCINLHASLLPLLRGASPIASTILNGFNKTGITFFKLERGVDSGDIIWQGEVPLNGDETAGVLHDYLAEFGGKVVSKVLLDYVKGELSLVSQDNKNVSYCTKLSREDGKIDWAKETAEEINRKILAFCPWPGTYTDFKGKRLKILKTAVSPERPHKIPGTVYLTALGEIAVRAKNKSVILNEVQLEGKRPCSINDFILGRKDFIGSILV